jgi:hypothetical protein
VGYQAHESNLHVYQPTTTIQASLHHTQIRKERPLLKKTEMGHTIAPFANEIWIWMQKRLAPVMYASFCIFVLCGRSLLSFQLGLVQIAASSWSRLMRLFYFYLLFELWILSLLVGERQVYYSTLVVGGSQVFAFLRSHDKTSIIYEKNKIKQCTQRKTTVNMVKELK